VWTDDVCVGFMSINPLQRGHVLVVPRTEVDHWIDLDADTAAHVFSVARTIGAAIDRAFSPERIGLLIAGFEVPHTHLHVVPVWGMNDLDFGNAAPTSDRAELEAAAAAIRNEL
jgi:histidine triad (HIT) family protein